MSKANISTYRVESFDNDMTADWDDLVKSSSASTFLQTRKFLSYHGDRFDDRSIVVIDKRGKLMAVLPSAVSPSDESVIESHPGITYGGLIFSRELPSASLYKIIPLMIDKLREFENVKEFHFKPLPFIYHSLLQHEFVYKLSVMGAENLKCGLSCAIDLDRVYCPSSRRRRQMSKAKCIRIDIQRGSGLFEPFWIILGDNLKERYDVKPVHSIYEIRFLKSLFPKEIELVVALYESEVIAGAVLFHSQNVCHIQYMATNSEGKKFSALDLVISEALEIAKLRGQRYLDFGISTRRDGTLNDGLHTYKMEFGAGSFLYEAYRLEL